MAGALQQEAEEQKVLAIELRMLGHLVGRHDEGREHTDAGDDARAPGNPGPSV